ncbi:cereblon family protein [Pseudodesulfovibrio pelocollis]|uniref:cereblon family protein n=1 Tax=Pseudodesulfovibrio pelocollis TaxID=3051432 RepID=UPI00255B027E|nr:cereblon family protein [Pseudodesulfovibrio sp. SB368]
MQTPEHLITPCRHGRIPSVLLKDAPGGTDQDDVALAAPDKGPDTTAHSDPARPVLVCRACRIVITARELAVAMGGAHRHVFFNPHGHVFEVGCFASARNILPTGPRTAEFSWFPGYAWQAVACAGCAAMLGWRFTGHGHAFFGLILPALVEADGPRP